MNRKLFISMFLLFASLLGQAQEGDGRHSLRGRVICDDMDVLGIAQIFLQNTSMAVVVDEKGFFELSDIPTGKYTVVAFAFEHQTDKKEIFINSDITVDFHLHEYDMQLEAVEVNAKEENDFGLTRLLAIDNMGIYEGKKSEVVILDDIVANKAANTARQVFSRVSGLNIWESDCAGIQLGVGGRGLSPNRSSNFNTRQNGVEISADALGYPESYYSPPVQALDRIEVVRGASSLQYGSQFGGLINFKLKSAPEEDTIQAGTSFTYGQYNYVNTFTEVAARKNKVGGYGYFQYRGGNCWRENSDFDAISGYASVVYEPTENSKITADYSKLSYVAQQPGGLTDQQFYEDPQISYRDRNWFQVDWNLFSLQYDQKLSNTLSINSRFFLLDAGRDAVGNLTAINRTDSEEFERTLITGDFFNFGNETRLLKRYQIGKRMGTVLAGVRLYKGSSVNLEGPAPDGSAADFEFIKADSLNYDYLNEGKNIAVFAENVLFLNDEISITPGIRYEHIVTSSVGYFTRPMPRDLAGNPLLPEDTDLRSYSDISRSRDFILLGLGLSYKPTSSLEFYGNWSQNYKSVSFSDIRITTPTLEVDPNLSDEKGFTSDLGLRGVWNRLFSYDVTLFAIQYENRIGTLLQRDENFRVFRYKTNVGDALNYGLESYLETDLLKLLRPNTEKSLSLFANTTFLSTRYTSGIDQVVGNEVEFSPNWNLRVGLSYKGGPFRSMVQWSYLSDQFSDATNAPNDPPVPAAVEGTIPSYQILDWVLEYQISKKIQLSGAINNILNTAYFTRRATGYPGPGILPSDGRNANISLNLRL